MIDRSKITDTSNLHSGSFLVSSRLYLSLFSLSLSLTLPVPSNKQQQMIVIFLQASFSAFQDWSTAKVMKSILNMLPAECLVVRDGNVTRITTNQLVVGDIVHQSMGNKVPADMVIVHTSGDFKVDNSVLTGENKPISVQTSPTDQSFLESKNLAFMGT
ncbi:hypothetical protein SAMD00019534_112480 [Acytostelium subglobosum LB1]|uniref:hypothetical protein n=1 Tax=Acytostelium subglobosum LB1 TaxID=1410327 RepID=UPI0006451105|nr:hypothetical protein SAMD00019534_112480 [Acytostelium subglobosum LB1]GAM28072.1 hypothetical protein SAMD00019534_112480 [Acytostelium subglobosum LB1]|eukprot:XP_012749031.1 hypothetical protein SAMD00019534_112480 [Acytostelium subglobosum LB1]